MGEYLCVASNGIVPSDSKMFKIRVQCQLMDISEANCSLMTCFHLVPPMFWIPSQLEGAYIGKDVTLECHSEAYPKSINYWVKQNGSMLISSKEES